ncbi:uncharacterized protein LOC120180650 [Hibiscus syriacus]|uniref:uncharacterized protein LOC120180650 n=1 Tax=Hibiscus syriacus TaxID=106335 RepID=UPI0019212AD6|nr:uncharacterized protein LOC120180650 [Hibiscus syriacus]
MAHLDRLPTRVRLQRMGITTEGNCVLCNNALETRDHLFFHCLTTAFLWDAILNRNGLSNSAASWVDMETWACEVWKGKSLLTTILKLARCAFIYTLWEERNRRIFQGRTRSLEDLKVIKEVENSASLGNNI